MSEVVVYTAIAVVHAPPAGDAGPWRPIADGAWSQLHLFLEMERHGGGQRQLLRDFRLVAWVLETGNVIVNDVLSADCSWLPVDDRLWQFTGADGSTYGFQFRTPEQADECAEVIAKVLCNLEEISELVTKVYETRSTTRDFLSLLFDLGFFKLDGARRSTMIQSAHAAVASLQHDSSWRRAASHTTTYPKQQRLEASAAGTDECRPAESFGMAAIEDPGSPEAGIILQSTMKRSSTHHLLAQFTEVELATLAATQQPHARESESESESDSDDGGGPDQAHVLCSPSGRRNDAECSRSAGASVLFPESGAVPVDCISLPYKTRQELHVTYNPALARYEGLPWAWRRLNHQFGLPLEAVPKRAVAPYEAKIPAVLEMLKASLIAHGGLGVEGIFRIAPDRDRCLATKQAINDGAFGGCADVHILASLIKVWFRELPLSLFNVVPEKHIYRVCELRDPGAVMRSVDAFPGLHRALLHWLLDLMADVVRHEARNKMSPRNMAIVLSPNLFSIDSDNPMYALTMSQKVADFTYALLRARLATTTMTTTPVAATSDAATAAVAAAAAGGDGATAASAVVTGARRRRMDS